MNKFIMKIRKKNKKILILALSVGLKGIHYNKHYPKVGSSGKMSGQPTSYDRRFSRTSSFWVFPGVTIEIPVVLHQLCMNFKNLFFSQYFMIFRNF